jgi:hypothetical protein
MRWCKNCGKVNSGWPARCRYCSVGLDGRLCTRGHVNPTDLRLSFCGECGQPLDRKSGAGFSSAPYLLAAAAFASTTLLSGLMTLVFKENPSMAALVALLILIFGLRLVFQILPPAAKSIAREAVNLFLRVILGTGNKG